MTRINRADADQIKSDDLRTEGLTILRSALFVDDEQANILTPVQTIALGRLRYTESAFLRSALNNGDWAEVAELASLKAALQQGLQKIELAAFYA